MKAWEDLERDPYVSLYWTGDDLDPDSHWYMDHGVKIEKFKDGRIEINNCMYAGDFYVPVTESQRYVFENVGWLPGCYDVCIDMYSARMLRINKLESSEDGIESVKNNTEKKLKRYLELRNNLVI